MVDDYPGTAGYVLGYCTDPQLYERRIRSFPKERWALLGKVTREKGLSQKDLDDSEDLLKEYLVKEIIGIE